MPSTQLLAQLAIVGLFVGCGFALLGQGLVLVYRTTRVINFAQGAIGSFSAYVAWEITGRSSPWAALAVALVIGALLGLVAELLCVRLAGGDLPGTSATLGLVIALQAIVLLRYGQVPLPFPSLAGHGHLRAAGLNLSHDVLLIGVLAMVVSGALFAFFRWSSLGLAMEAVAQDELGAVVNGVRPRLVRRMSWMIASVLAALAAVLLTALFQLQPTLATELTLTALVLGLLAGLRSFSGVVAAAVAYGVLRSVLTGFTTGWVDDVARSLPFILAVTALVVAGDRLGITSQGREV